MLGKNQGRRALKWGTCSYSNTENSTVHCHETRQRTSVYFKLAVPGGTGAGGLLAPLPCTAYFGKLAKNQKHYKCKEVGMANRIIKKH